MMFGFRRDKPKKPHCTELNGVRLTEEQARKGWEVVEVNGLTVKTLTREQRLRILTGRYEAVE